MITILGYISEDERGYVQALRELIPGVNLKITTKTPALTSDISLTAKLAGAAGVFVTVPEIGEKLVNRGANVTTKYSQSDFAGSLVKCGSIDVVLMDDLSQIRTTSTGKHLAARWLSKITAKDSWPKTPEFRYELCNDPDKAKRAALQLSSADFIAYDIETIKHHLFFDVIGFTGVWISKLAEQDGPLTYTTRSFAFPHSDEVMQLLIQQVLQNSVKKIAQNGKYDNAYLIRWGMPPVNWICDTAHFFHSWYCELPKRLDFITAYSLRDVQFWKDDGEGSFAARAEYCGRDTWATACTWMSFMERAPDWAFRNYVDEFTVNPACILAEHTGLDLVPEGAEWNVFSVNKSMVKRANWLRDLIYTVRTIEMYKEDDNFPLHGSGCVSFGKQCGFYGTCDAPTVELVPVIPDYIEEDDSKYHYSFTIEELLEQQMENAA